MAGKIILTIVLCIAAVIVLLVACNMPYNNRSMEQGIAAALETIRRDAAVTEQDAGKYKEMRMHGIMHFHVKQYEVKKIGNLSVMTMNAGLMQMFTIILTPIYKDIPLLSADYIYMLGKRTSYLECYDLVLDQKGKYQNLLRALQEVKKAYADLDTLKPSSAWYDSLRTIGIYMKGSRKDDQKETEALKKWMEVVMKYAEELPLLTETERKEKLPAVTAYTDGLIEQGGVSTDLFVKELGKEETRIFFNQVLFGTEADFCGQGRE